MLREGLSVAACLRNVALGYEIRGVIDQDLVLKLAKINGDQDRLGGLLKWWLTDDEKLGEYDSDQMLSVIQGVLSRLDQMQIVMLDVVKRG